jgi:DNA-binding Lrp family transcriptional regulator
MPKSSKKQIDADEKKVINELKINSKESIDKLAQKCGFSRQKVWRIIKKLEENKTIWGYPAIVDDEKLKLKKFIFLLKRNNKPISSEKLEIATSGEVRKELAKRGVNIEFNLLVHGDYDLIICATAPSIKETILLSNQLSTLFGEYIAEIKTLDVIFPIQKGGLENPNIHELKEFFL